MKVIISLILIFISQPLNAKVHNYISRSEAFKKIYNQPWIVKDDTLILVRLRVYSDDARFFGVLPSNVNDFSFVPSDSTFDVELEEVELLILGNPIKSEIYQYRRNRNNLNKKYEAFKLVNGKFDRLPEKNDVDDVSDIYKGERKPKNEKERNEEIKDKIKDNKR